MLGYLKRLVTTGAAYQFGGHPRQGHRADHAAAVHAPRSSPSAYGAAESLLTAVILSSILLRVGVGEAFIRFYFDDEDDGRRERIARTATAAVAWTTTRRPRCWWWRSPASSRSCCSGVPDPQLIDCAALGLWAFTNLEMAYAQLRVDERARTYVFASGANVAMTVAFTVALVVFADQGARGLLLGNFGASAIVVLGLWWVLRRRFSLRVRLADLRAMLRFGLPTVPADASVYALQVADRFYLFRVYSHAAAGLYAVAIKLATVVFVAVRGFQYAWPPLAYSIEQRRGGGAAVLARHHLLRARHGRRSCAAVALLGRWMVQAAGGARVLRRLPRAAVAGARLGALRAVPGVRRDRRPRARDLAQLPRRARAGLAVNVALLVLLVPAQRRRPRDRGRRAGAVRRLRGDARGHATCSRAALFAGRLRVARGWRSSTAILAGVAVSGELLLPTSGLGGPRCCGCCGSRWSRRCCC